MQRFVYILFTMFAYLSINVLFCQQQKWLRVGKKMVNTATGFKCVDLDGQIRDGLCENASLLGSQTVKEEA